MVDVIKIEGIGPTYAKKLKEIGITKVEELLQKGATPEGRKQIAEKMAIFESLVLEWVNRADLFRIKGVGEEYSDLLEAAGVDTVVELAKRKADNLHPKIMAINQEKKLVRKPPTQSQVSDWIEQAKKLPRAVTY
jgi:predicted flap endonuclease-1-like 5' DNA nuclease